MLDDRTWLLIGRKMANEASQQELKELESILRSNPELHFSLQTLTDLWQKTPRNDHSELEEAYTRLLERMKESGPAVPGSEEDELPDAANIAPYPHTYRKPLLRRVGFQILVLATLVVIIIGVIDPFGNKNMPPAATRHEESEISTRYGSKTNIVLPDGSKVWLNAGSKITYDNDFGELNREVKLTGEAYFDVVHLAGKPFIIHTRAMDIKVLGTEFNVKSYPDEKTTETSLIRGSIEVSLNDKRAEKIIMKPNEKLVVSNEDEEENTVVVAKKRRTLKNTPIISLGALNYFSLDSTILETSWVSNRLIFEDESFEEIAIKMSRWFGVDFNFEDDDIKHLRFTGNFQDESVNEALEAMQITADFRFSLTDKKVIITKH